MKLTQLQRSVLEQCDTRWLRPMDMGAHDATHHSGVLAALVSKGLVERKQRGGMMLYARGSYIYRLTAEGEAELSIVDFGARDDRAPMYGGRDEDGL